MRGQESRALTQDNELSYTLNAGGGPLFPEVVASDSLKNHVVLPLSEGGAARDLRSPVA
jgi:hypothetical protein